jgi:hypothetical protein
MASVARWCWVGEFIRPLGNGLRLVVQVVSGVIKVYIHGTPLPPKNPDQTS